MTKKDTTNNGIEDELPSLDGIDISALAPPVGGAFINVKRVTTKVPVRKPSQQNFFRVKEGAEWTAKVQTIYMKDDRAAEMFLIAPNLGLKHAGELQDVQLYTGYEPNGTVFLIPVFQANRQTGKQNAWHQSLAYNVHLAHKAWIRITVDFSIQGYQTFEAEGEIPEPPFPDDIHCIMDLIKIAFRDRWINTDNHEVLIQLRGGKI
jgi:hypothetical protein